LKTHGVSTFCIDFMRTLDELDFDVCFKGCVAVGFRDRRFTWISEFPSSGLIKLDLPLYLEEGQSMPFRSRAFCLFSCVFLLSVASSGCATCQAVRDKISQWNLGTRRPSRRHVVRPAYPTPSYPKTACPNGPWPNGLPASRLDDEHRATVVPAPEPEEQAPMPERLDNEDSLSVPLPAPPRLPVQSNTGRSREIRNPRSIPELTDDPTFEPQPANSFATPAPRLAERFETPGRNRQPVQLQVPETDLEFDSMTETDEESLEELPTFERGPTPVQELPNPAFDSTEDEDFELPPPPNRIDSSIEPQSYGTGKSRTFKQQTLRQPYFETY